VPKRESSSGTATFVEGNQRHRRTSAGLSLLLPGNKADKKNVPTAGEGKPVTSMIYYHSLERGACVDNCRHRRTSAGLSLLLPQNKVDKESVPVAGEGEPVTSMTYYPLGRSGPNPEPGRLRVYVMNGSGGNG